MARRRSKKSRRSSKSRGRGRSKARRSYSRKGTRGRRGGRWTERRARKKARFYQGRYRKSHGKASRRNPVGQLRDGSMINVDGRSVTLTSKYGETYEYDEVSGSTLRALISAKTFSAAQRACSKSGVLRSINPKRRGRKGRGRKSRR